MTDFASFNHGNVAFPLSTTDVYSLLRAADPAIFYGLEFFKSVIVTHIEDRLLQEAVAAGADQITEAVAETLPLNPEPFLADTHIRFPLLALHRKGTVFRYLGQRRVSIHTLELAYVLPPMKASEAEKLLPILHAVEVLLDNRTEQGFDPAYTPSLPTGTAGELVWKANRAGVVRVEIMSGQTGGYTPTEDLFFPAVVLTLQMEERSEANLYELADAGGGDVAIDLTDNDGAETNFVQVQDMFAPLLTSLNVITGATTGGTAVAITGQGFTLDTTPDVLFGDAAATSVVVVSTTSITCVTPAHAAGAVAIQVIAADDRESNILSGAFTYVAP